MSVKEIIVFDKLLYSLTESKPPVSASKITDLTKSALKYTKVSKHIVSSVEKFIVNCSPEYKLSGLYVIDSICKAAQKVNTPESNQYPKRFNEKIEPIFSSLKNAPAKDKEKIRRLSTLWKKSPFFSSSSLEKLEKKYLPESSAKGKEKTSDRSSRRDSKKDSDSPEETSSELASDINTTNSEVLNTLAALTKSQPVPAIVNHPQSAGNVELMSAILQAQGVSQEQLISVIMNAQQLQQQNIPLPSQNVLAAGSPFNCNEEDSKSLSSQLQMLSSVLLPNTQIANQQTVGQTGSVNPTSWMNANNNAANVTGTPTNDSFAAFQNLMNIQSGNLLGLNQTAPTSNFNSSENLTNSQSNFSKVEEKGKSKFSDPGDPPYCKEAEFGVDVPPNHIKVLSRTLYVGCVNKEATKENLRSTFEEYGKVQSVTINYDKYHAFIKMGTRDEALNAHKNLQSKLVGESCYLRVKWGVGFGPRDKFDFEKGESILPIDALTLADKNTMEKSARGGGKCLSQYVMEEPDLGNPLIDSAHGTPSYPPNHETIVRQQKMLQAQQPQFVQQTQPGFKKFNNNMGFNNKNSQNNATFQKNNNNLKQNYNNFQNPKNFPMPKRPNNGGFKNLIEGGKISNFGMNNNGEKPSFKNIAQGADGLKPHMGARGNANSSPDLMMKKNFHYAAQQNFLQQQQQMQQNFFGNPADNYQNYQNFNNFGEDDFNSNVKVLGGGGGSGNLGRGGNVEESGYFYDGMLDNTKKRLNNEFMNQESHNDVKVLGKGNAGYKKARVD
ncbi:hypothetical protein HK099_006292 [Clydaea vesicula]|uniref:Uncharacterized protein n=1 Tax=Clydaea vesicula TaxID=447962 RepID=A0AAD5U2N1_9FUNG|nr:hypothetical protein HK099_006292 [Clydaea vesicula]